MQSSVQKWGNSLAVRIPGNIAKSARLITGSTVTIEFHKGRIVIQPEHENTYRLEDLLEGVTRKNRHKEFDWGKPVGKEIW